MTMGNYRDLMEADIRYNLCRILSEDRGYSLNSDILHAALNSLRYNVSRDQLNNHLIWLSDMGLVRLETVGSMNIALLTDRGLDAAKGNAKIDGVRQPLPHELD